MKTLKWLFNIGTALCALGAILYLILLFVYPSNAVDVVRTPEELWNAISSLLSSLGYLLWFVVIIVSFHHYVNDKE